MKKFLILDIGAGTIDILYHEIGEKILYKNIMPSPSLQLSCKIKKCEGNLLITGCEMGGGTISKTLISKAKKQSIKISKNAANTINHDLKKVEAYGLSIIKNSEIDFYRKKRDYSEFELTDIRINDIKKIFEIMNVDFQFDCIAVCAQDHGLSPKGISHTNFRHEYFSNALNKYPNPSSLLHNSNSIPKSMNRLSSIGKSINKFNAKKKYVMDSSMAAILGASMDISVCNKKKIITLDIATSHTVGAAIKDGLITSFFEYHTKDITPNKLDYLIKALPEGKMSHEKILKDGGHGYYNRSSFQYNDIEKIIVTGPKRHIVKNCKFPITFGAPWGDNMMTGTTGLMEAIRLKENLKKIYYV